MFIATNKGQPALRVKRQSTASPHQEQTIDSPSLAQSHRSGQAHPYPLGETLRAGQARGPERIGYSFEDGSVPAAAIRNMLNWVLFQLLIGNSDAHGKNISFFVGPAGIDMAPAYDLLNLDMYAAGYDRDFSMSIGDAFAPEDISPWELAEMCERCNLQKRLVANTLTALSGKLLKAMDAIDLSPLLPGEETEFAGEVIAAVRKNVERYLPYAKQLPVITA